MTPSALRLDGITKRFGRLVALDRAHLTVARGTVHALLGENGAGKTTLMRVAFGMLHPDRGTIAVDSVARRFASPTDAIRAGLGMVHQHYALAGALTVAENVALGLRGRYDPRAAATRVERLSQATGLALDPTCRVDELSVETQQRVEIVKALARDARILILDEPTAVLAPASATELLQWLRRFADGGGTVILITHKLHEALSVADDVTVLRHGCVTLEAQAAEISEDDLAAAMLGHAMSDDAAALVGAAFVPPAVSPPPSRSVRVTPPDAKVEVIRADRVSLTNARGATVVRNASFAVRRGEIVAIAAIEGQGQHELLRALAGRVRVADGTLTIPDRVGFVPEDRQRDALIVDFPAYENIALRGIGRARGRVLWANVREHTRQLLRDFDIRAAGDATPPRELSGGNQQRLVLARELDGDPPAVVAENPTRGLDVQASAAVQERLRAARDAGAAVVVYASDIDDSLSIADRVLVVAHGQVREVPLDREVVGRAMLGLA